MADPEFWRWIEPKFRRLQAPPPQQGEVHRDSHNGLCAHWRGEERGDDVDPWYFSNAERGTKELFKWAAERAAVELGHPGGQSAVFFWLDLLRRDAPFYKSFGSTGYIFQVCNASAEYCLKLETDAKAAANATRPPEQHASDRPSRATVGGETTRGISEGAMHNLPDLPSRYQNAFEVEKAKAELEFATRAERLPNQPQFAESPLHPLRLIQTVFFAFCKQALDACRTGDLTPAQVSQSVEAAWPAVCDHYVVRERGPCSEEAKSSFRVPIWRTITDDQQWKQHQLELKALAEGAGAATTARPQPQPGGTGHPKANAPHDISNSSQAVVKKATSQTEFWKERQAEFEKYAKQFSDLKAHWNSAYGRWTLWWGSTPEGIHIPQQCKDVFNAIARTRFWIKTIIF